MRAGHGPRVRIKPDYGTPEFWNDYRVAVETTPREKKPEGPAKGSLAWLIALSGRT